MQTLSSFTLDKIREQGSCLEWMEEQRFEWVSLVANFLSRAVDGKTIIVATDKEREWLASYIINKLNQSFIERPLLPVVSLMNIFPKLDNIKENEEYEILEDMLEFAFPNGYTYLYIGDGRDKMSTLPKREKNSFLWLIDEKSQNGFYLSSSDKILDIKLLSLVNLLDKSLDAALFAEVDLESLL